MRLTSNWRPSDDEQLNTQLAGYISYIKLEMQNKGIDESHIGKLNGCGATDIAINWLRTRRRYKQQSQSGSLLQYLRLPPPPPGYEQLCDQLDDHREHQHPDHATTSPDTTDDEDEEEWHRDLRERW